METVSDVLELLEEILEGFDKAKPESEWQWGYLDAIQDIYELINRVP